MKNAQKPESTDLAKSLQTPLEFFPGVGTERAELLHKLGVQRPVDLLFLFPRSYLDVAKSLAFSELQPDIRCSVDGTVDAIDLRCYPDGRSALGILLRVDNGYVRLTWFNQPFRRHQFAHGMRVLATGTPKPTGVSWEMRHPEYLVLDKDQSAPQLKPNPVYPLTEGLQQRHLIKIMDGVVQRLVPAIGEVLPESFRAKYQLMDIATALQQIHQPDTLESAHSARHRFIFQELFVYQLALAMRRYQLQHGLPAPRLEVSGKIKSRIIRRFDFELTTDQQRAIDEVGQDMSCSVPMNRLIQGDVGSGKTVIALYAMLLAVAHGHQAAMMAPTEVLARQHVQRLRSSLAGSHVEIELLTGTLGQREKGDLLERIAIGTVDLVVGTQALLSEKVEFAKLGLVVIDEQHRFGVEQRAALRTATTQPHYLVLSATPIPRTLTMTAFGDLDVSILREKPAGRAVVHTYLGKLNQQESWWQFLRNQVQQGRQAYVITPRVERSAEDDVAGATQTFEVLSQGLLSGLRIGLLHGRMDGSEKQVTLEAFEQGAIQVLVATTVVEVGIDVPNATVMTILDADRLGLAQLHQLRGRISRGTHPGYCCVFASGGASPDENARLKALESTHDGFQLAELDLQMRGPGNLLGTRQTGLPPFRIADLVRDMQWVIQAREAAQEVILADPKLDLPEWQGLQRQVNLRHGDMLTLGDVG